MVQLKLDTVIEDSGLPDRQPSDAPQHPIEDLPNETLAFLLPSRYCEVDKLSDIAWKEFSHTPPGWQRVQAICTWVNKHITFGYHFASSTKSAWDVYQQGEGVCRDFNHLALTFCRCMNIPARYVTGYLGDIGVPHQRLTRWTSARGSKFFSAENGFRSTRGTTSRASAAFSWRPGVTRPMLP